MFGLKQKSPDWTVILKLKKHKRDHENTGSPRQKHKIKQLLSFMVRFTIQERKTTIKICRICYFFFIFSEKESNKRNIKTTSQY